MKLTPSPRAAALTGAALAVAALPLLSMTAPATAADAPTTTYSKDLPYECDVTAASGTTPAINVPNTKQVTITAPEKFDILANLYKPDGSSQPVKLVCQTETSRTVAVIPVGERTTVTPRLPATIKARTATSFRTEVRGASTLPTGVVSVRLEDGTQVASDNLNANGDVRLPLPKFGKVGKRTLTVTYGGDGVHGQVTVTKSFTVVR